MKQPFVSASGRLTHEPGSKSGARCQQTDFPWPAAFPPPPPQPGHCRPDLVRQRPRYYAAVRLLSTMAHRRTPLGFPMRSALNVAEDAEISRFPCEMFPRVHGVSDRAGLWPTSRYRCSRRSLPLLLTASASRRKLLTRLNTRPARSPVNASTLPLRAAPHDSGPMWVAKPLTYDFCIHYTSPV